MKRRAVLHKIYILLFVFMMFIKNKPLSPPALLAAEVAPIATKTLKPGYCPLPQLNSTILADLQKSAISHLKAFKLTSIRCRDLNKDW